MPCGRLLLSLLTVLGLPAVTGAIDSRPNFILFIADDMAWDDCGPYGHPHIRTPNLNQLAKDGMRFDRAFLTCSSCSPSRSSIITGRYPHNTGAHQLHQPLPGDQVTFVEQLTAAGYYTAAAGKWHLGDATIPKFSKVVPQMDQWVKTLQERPQRKPFFLWFAFSDPHRPYQKNAIDQPHQPEDAVVPPYLPDNATTRADLASYYDEITRMDAAVGDVVAELDRQGLTQQTLVLFISDNGRPFPRCKTTVYDSGVRTPWIVKWPGQVKADSVCSQLVSTVDLAPSFLTLANIKPPATCEGVSLLPLFVDRESPVREYIVAEHNWHDFDDHARCIRDTRYKYIRNDYTDIPGTPPADAVGSPTFQEMIRLHRKGLLPPEQSTCFTTPRPAEEFYDLEKDPHELTNQIDNPAYAAEVARLREQFQHWQTKTGDRVPESRRPDEFDRWTGKRLSQNKPARQP